jgi:hypothetical protein
VNDVRVGNEIVLGIFVRSWSEDRRRGGRGRRR